MWSGDHRAWVAGELRWVRLSGYPVLAKCHRQVPLSYFRSMAKGGSFKFRWEMLGQGIQSMHIEKSAIKIIVDEIIAENPTICRMAGNLDVLNTDVADVKLQGRTNTHAINELFLEQRRQGVMMEEMRSDSDGVRHCL